MNESRAAREERCLMEIFLCNSVTGRLQLQLRWGGGGEKIVELIEYFPLYDCWTWNSNSLTEAFRTIWPLPLAACWLVANHLNLIFEYFNLLARLSIHSIFFLLISHRFRISQSCVVIRLPISCEGFFLAVNVDCIDEISFSINSFTS